MKRRRLLELLAPFRWWMLLAAVLGFATVGSGVGLMATSAYLISKAALRPSIAELQLAIVGVRLFGITRGVFRYFERLVAHDVTFRLLERLRVAFYRALEPLAPARLLGFRGGDLLTRAVADVETLQELFARGVAPPVVAGLVTGLVALILGVHDPTLGALAAAGLVLGGGAAFVVATRLDRGPGRRRIKTRARLAATLVDGVQGVADLVAFGHGEAHRAEIERLSAALARDERRAASIAGLGAAAVSFLTHATALTVLAAAIPLVRDGRLDGVALGVVVLTVLAGFEAVDALVPAFRHLEASDAAAGRIEEILDAEPAVRDPEEWTEKWVAPFEHLDLVVENLTFTYPGATSPAVDDLSFTVPEGKSLLLAGPSGAGKSTILRLLLRFWDVEHGRILLGGIDLCELPAETVRSKINVVAQDTHLFTGTVRSNLLLARPEASDDDLWRALERARLGEHVRTLPRGLDTWIGEAGHQLSGGERQRLAVARAFLEDAPILLLDEPTTHLDPATEVELWTELRDLMHGRTTIVVSHRPVGFPDADQVLELTAPPRQPRDGR